MTKSKGLKGGGKHNQDNFFKGNGLDQKGAGFKGKDKKGKGKGFGQGEDDDDDSDLWFV